MHRAVSSTRISHARRSGRRLRQQGSISGRARRAAACGDAIRRSGASIAAVQDTIANRLGWLDSPALMAASIDRIRAVAARRPATPASRTSCCSAWADRASRRKCSARWSASSRLAATAHARLDRSRRRCARSRTDPATHAVPAREQVGHDHRTELARGAFSAGARGRRHRRLGASISSRSPTTDTALASRAQSGRFRRRASSTRPTSAAAIRRCRSSDWCRPR